MLSQIILRLYGSYALAAMIFIGGIYLMSMGNRHGGAVTLLGIFLCVVLIVMDIHFREQNL